MKKVFAVLVALIVVMVVSIMIADDARAVLSMSKSGRWAVSPSTKRDRDSTYVVRVPVFEAGRGQGCGARGVCYGINIPTALSTNGAATRDTAILKLYSFNGSIRTLVKTDTMTITGSKAVIDSTFTSRFSRELALEVLIIDTAGTQDSLSGNVQWFFNLIGE